MKSQLFYPPISTTLHLFIFSGGVRGPPYFVSKFLKPLSIPYIQEKPQEVHGKINSVSKSTSNKGQSGLKHTQKWVPKCSSSIFTQGAYCSKGCPAFLPNLWSSRVHSSFLVCVLLIPHHPSLVFWLASIPPTFLHGPSLSPLSNHELIIRIFLMLFAAFIEEIFIQDFNFLKLMIKLIDISQKQKQIALKILKR